MIMTATITVSLAIEGRRPDTLRIPISFNVGIVMSTQLH